MVSVYRGRSIQKSLRTDAGQREKQLRAALRKEYAMLKVQHPELDEEQLIALFLDRHREQRKIAIKIREAKEAKKRQKARSRNAKAEQASAKHKGPPTKRTKVLPAPSGSLPDWDASRGVNDAFSRGRIVSGGGYGLGKNRKH